MPELAAHLERVAREVAGKFCYNVYAWRGRSPGFMQTMVALLAKDVAAALAACAREAKLEEANAAYWCWKLSHEDFGANQQKRLDELRKDG